MIVKSKDGDLFGEFTTFCINKMVVGDDYGIYGKAYDGDYLLGSYDKDKAQVIFQDLYNAVKDSYKWYEMPGGIVMDKLTEFLFNMISFVSKIVGFVIFLISVAFMLIGTFICVLDFFTEGASAFDASTTSVFIGSILLLAIGTALCIFSEMIRERDE